MRPVVCVGLSITTSPLTDLCAVTCVRLEASLLINRDVTCVVIIITSLRIERDNYFNTFKKQTKKVSLFFLLCHTQCATEIMPFCLTDFFFVNVFIIDVGAGIIITVSFGLSV